MTETATWVDTVWGDQRGWAIVSVAGPNLEDWHDLAFRWPRRRTSVLRRIELHSPHSNVWVAPLLRSAPRRVTETATLPGRWLWADLDSALLPAILSRLSAWLIESGRPGHRHVYVPLAEPQPPDVIERYNHRLTRALGGDACWYRNGLLRPPGTLNHKPGAGPVRIMYDPPSPASHGLTLDCLDALLPQTEPPLRKLDGATRLPDPEPVDIDALPWWLKFKMHPLPSDIQGMDRDRVTWDFMAACVRARLTDGQVRWMVEGFWPAAQRAAEKDPTWLYRTVEHALPKLRATNGRLSLRTTTPPRPAQADAG